jgi:hypothetical protein
MGRKHDGQEVDYLAGAQPEENPREFRQLVREAFALQYGTTKDYHIAAIIERDKSRVAQIFRRPEKAESVSIHHLISFLKSREHRRRIVEAWSVAYFALAAEGSTGYLGTVATERTRRRIDRLIREGQLSLAARVSLEAIKKAEDEALREEFLDRAYFLFQRLDQPGQAMRIARLVATRARSSGDGAREGAALMMRCRILMGLADTKPEEVLPVLARAKDLLEVCTASDRLTLLGRLHDQQDACHLAFFERGVVPVDEEHVKQILARAEAKMKRAQSYQARSRHALLAARCHLLLGERFQAEELLEASFKSGDIKNLNAYEISGLFMGHILKASDAPLERQEQYLSEVIANCQGSSDRYHLRVAEWDLARIEAKLFSAPDQAPVP